MKDPTWLCSDRKADFHLPLADANGTTEKPETSDHHGPTRRLGHCKGQCSRIGTASCRCAVNEQCLHARCKGKGKKRTDPRRSYFNDIEFMPAKRDGRKTELHQKDY